jgi:hypothetical protein
MSPQMTIIEFLTNNNLVYAINPVTFISQLKNDYILVFQEILDMEDVNHFTIGTNIKTKHYKTVYFISLKAEFKDKWTARSY